MCESTVYIKKENAEEKLMENVAAITPLGEDRYQLKGLLGDVRELHGTLVDINLMDHKIVFSIS